MVPLTILVVDDDELSRDLLRILLTHEGYAVETASSGDEALHLLAGASPIDLVLADLQMPGIAGSTLAHNLRVSPRTPRLLLAMSGSQPAANQIAGYDGFLLKPFSMEALAETIRAKDSASTDPTKQVNATTHPALNMETYNRLKAAIKPEKLEQLYSLCFDDIARRLATMRSSASVGDDAVYRREAHAIKGGCGIVGALELQGIAASAETDGIHTNHVATLDEIAAATERLKRILIARRNHT